MHTGIEGEKMLGIYHNKEDPRLLYKHRKDPDCVLFLGDESKDVKDPDPDPEFAEQIAELLPKLVEQLRLEFAK